MIYIEIIAKLITIISEIYDERSEKGRNWETLPAVSSRDQMNF